MRPDRKLTAGIPGLLRIIKPPGQDHPSETFAWLLKSRPQIVQGFPTALEVFARYCADQSRKPPQPQLVISRGETLFAEVRQLLEGVFRARVMDLYNCQEVGNVAWQCPADPMRMHVNEGGCVVEIVNEEGQPIREGETGLVVLTNLFNRTMPFVRYVIGDRGRLLRGASTRCACGSNAQIMGPVEGRADDTLRLPDGTWVSPRVAATLLLRRSDGAAIHGLQRYQIIQEEPDRLRIRVVLGDVVDADWREVLSQAGDRELGGLPIDVEQVADLPFEYSGKFKRVVSRL